MIPLPIALAAIVLLRTIPGDEPRVVNLVNLVEGQTTILRLIGEGERVKKGQLLGELDSAAIRDKLTNQKINVAQAVAAALAAKSALEIAEDTVIEVEVATAEEIKTTEGEVRIAELDIKINKQKIEDAKVQKKVGNSRGELDKATSDLARAENARTRSKAKLKTLVEYTKNRRMVEAQADAKRAAVEAESAQAILELEKARVTKLKKQIEACNLIAPADGQVHYANPAKPRFDGYRIEEGAIVRERQTILRIVRESP